MDVWIATYSQITVVSEKKDVKARYWKYIDFNDTQNRPDTFVEASGMEIVNNPLVVLARWLGKSSYEGLSNAHKKGITLPGDEPLYGLAMFGNYYSHHPYFPEELTSLLDGAESTVVWRKLACMLHGAKAKELCELELNEWPLE